MQYAQDCMAYGVKRNSIMSEMGEFAHFEGPSRPKITFGFKKWDTKNPPFGVKDLKSYIANQEALPAYVSSSIMNKTGCDSCKNPRIRDIQVDYQFPRGIFTLSFDFSGPETCFGRLAEGIFEQVSKGIFLPVTAPVKLRNEFNGDMIIDMNPGIARKFHRDYKEIFGPMLKTAKDNK